jgi:hypothetical protein
LKIFRVNNNFCYDFAKSELSPEDLEGQKKKKEKIKLPKLAGC